MAETLAHRTTARTPRAGASSIGPIAFAALLLLAVLPFVLLARGNLFPLYQVQSQDLPILLALPVMLVALRRWTPPLRLPDRAPSPRLMIVAGCVLLMLLGWGTYAVMENFPVSRDEHMIWFDMAVYAKGRLAAPLAPEWRDYAGALVPGFLLNGDHPIGLVSDYLPVNALLRLGFSQIADPVFYNPLMALLGGVALHDIARRTFGRNGGAIWTTMLVYALSTQMLVNAMSSYAMTGHMALNLIWLAAFLRGGRAGHAVAILVALLACGLHQLVFHPLFAAPFLLWRLRQGEWRLVLAYGAAYALILGWWMVFPMFSALQTGVARTGADHSLFADKMLPLLLQRDPLTIPLMTLNLLRFVAWQNLALLPLLFAAIPFALRDRGLAAPLLWGIAGLLAFVTLILPYQGHGWGYRYLHPFLGSMALLAGFGFQRLAAEGAARAQALVATLSLATVLGAMPLLLWTSHSFIAPQAALARYAAAQPGDFVILDTFSPKRSLDGRWAINAVDEVQNMPDLDDRPLRLSAHAITEARARELCGRGTVSLIDKAAMHRLGFGLNVPEQSPRFDAIRRVVRAENCLAR